jgi:molybdopterin-containing oxidoreductase family iron-sulfur binding subunit
MADRNGTETRAGSARRRFFGALAGAGTGALTAIAGAKLLSTAQVEAAAAPPPLAEATGNVTVRMQGELERSLASGRTPSWLMVVDTRKCIGCDACTIACKAENPTGPGAGFRRVVKRELGMGVKPWAIFKPVNCLQCDDPPCAKVVPAGMVRKRADGIVEFDGQALKGQFAQAAMQACPLHQIHIDNGKTFTENTPAQQAYEEREFVENGRVNRRKKGASDVENSARKCNFCSHLLDVGILPACVTTCLGGAMYFGDANDPGGLIQEITQGRRQFTGHENLGLKPRVIYFEESMPDATHLTCGACHS